jgi:hypothetical protein
MANAASMVRQATQAGRGAPIRRQADEENPAQPVPEPAPAAATDTDEGAVTPDAKEEVTSPGGEPPQAEMAPDAVVDVTTPGQVTPEPQPDAVTDPTIPVAGALPDEQTKVSPDVEVNDTITPNAFTDGWTAAQRAKIAQMMQRNASRVRARIFASLRLADLRIANGLADRGSDLITEARRIEASDDSDESLRTQMQTIAAMAQVRPAPTPTARRTASRIPSLAGVPAPEFSTTAAAQGDDEFLFD